MSAPSLRSLDEVERICSNMETFVQTLRARAKRIEQIRAALATLTAEERIGLLCEAIGIDEDTFFRMVDSVMPQAEPGHSSQDATAPEEAAR